MAERKSAIDFDKGGGKRRLVTPFPDECPQCRHGIAPKFVYATILGDESKGQAAFICPRSACGHFFVSTYETPDSGEAFLLGSAPQRSVPRAFSSEIAALSPSFVAIYNDAIAAEAHGLANVVGIGLRKSLEFLVKDFCISQDTARADAIRAKFLGNVIKEDVKDARLKATAERAVWLGNDETHYERRWQGKDVQDLKVLIELSIHWVESELLTAKFENEMPAAGKH